MADVSVRPARPSDARDVARVQLSTWRTAYAEVLPPEALALPEDDVAQAWAAAVTAPPGPQHRVLVALEKADVVGFAAAAPSEEVDGAAELTALLVEPRWGRRGHGSRLLAACVDGWRADGVGLAVTWVWERDPALRALLAASGWEPDGAVRGLDTGARVQRQVRLHTSLAEV